MSITRKSKIIGVGSFVPPNVWTNDDLQKLMDTSDEWIQQRTGIKQRHWVDQNSTQCATDLAVEAAKNALNSAGMKKEDLDMIVFATISPDHTFPGNGCFFQAKLDVPGIPAFEVRQQCSGFLYGLSLADQFIKTGMNKNVLLVGAELHSKGLDKTTAGRDLAVLFGDGAGALVLTAADKDAAGGEVLATKLYSDGRFARELWAPLPSLDEPGDWITPEKIATKDYYPKMNGKTVFVNACKRMPEALMAVLGETKYKLEDVDLFLFHQANMRINEMVAKQMGIPAEKVFNTIERFGNTTAATIPIGMDEAVKAGKLKPGMLVASAAFGSGFTWAAALIRW